MTPERIITAATITSGEKHDGKEMQRLVEKVKSRNRSRGSYWRWRIFRKGEYRICKR